MPKETFLKLVLLLLLLLYFFLILDSKEHFTDECKLDECKLFEKSGNIIIKIKINDVDYYLRDYEHIDDKENIKKEYIDKIPDKDNIFDNNYNILGTSTSFNPLLLTKNINNNIELIKENCCYIKLGDHIISNYKNILILANTGSKIGDKFKINDNFINNFEPIKIDNTDYYYLKYNENNKIEFKIE